MRRVVLLIGLGLGACGDDGAVAPADTSAADTSATTDTSATDMSVADTSVALDTSTTSDTSVADTASADVEIIEAGVDPLFGWAGSIRMIEQYEGAEMGVLDTYVLVDMDSAPPVPYLAREANIGACTLYARPDVTCDPACTSGTRCGSDGQCHDEPTFRSAGTLTFDGLSAALVGTPTDDVRYTVAPEPASNQLFTDTATITVAASGGAVPAFEVAVDGVSNVALAGPTLVELHDDEDALLRWDPDGSDAMIELRLQLGWHGTPPTSVIYCTRPDSAGQIAISKALIQGFDYYEGGLFQHPSYLDRVQRVAVPGPFGPIEVVAMSRTTLFVTHAAE